jgi:heptosyltransferase-2
LAFRVHKQPQRILLVRNDGIGDVVLTLPAFAAVRRQFPQAHLAALLSPGAADLLAGCRDLDERIVDDPTDGSARLARRLKEKRFDTAVVFNTQTRNCLAVWRAGIRVRVCWGYKPVGFLLGSRRIALHRSHPPLHESKFAMAFVRRLGVEERLADFAPRLEIDDAVRQRVAARIANELGTSGPLFGIHPGSKNSAYNWPESHYAQLVSRLSKAGRVMVTGATSERALLERIRHQSRDAASGRVGFFWDFPMLELAAAISQQTALTVSSTGPMHVGGITGTPLVALFSPHPLHSPKKWAPLGTAHTLLVAPLESGEDPHVPREKSAAVMARISVEQVVEANLKIVQETLAARRPEQYSDADISKHAA